MRTSEKKGIKHRNSSTRGQDMHVATMLTMQFPSTTLPAFVELGLSKIDRCATNLLKYRNQKKSVEEGMHAQPFIVCFIYMKRDWVNTMSNSKSSHV